MFVFFCKTERTDCGFSTQFMKNLQICYILLHKYQKLKTRLNTDLQSITEQIINHAKNHKKTFPNFNPKRFRRSKKPKIYLFTAIFLLRIIFLSLSKRETI